MKNTLLLLGLLFSIQYSIGQERITSFMYKDKGIDALTRTLSKLNGSLIFNAYTENYGDEMWLYNAQDSLKLLKDILTGSSSSFPDYQSSGFTEYNNEIYFIANDSVHGYELWKTNGTETKIVHDVLKGKESSTPSLVTIYNDYLYFVGSTGDTYSLYKSDGTNLELVKDFGKNEYGVAYRITELIPAENNLFIKIHNSNLWVSNGTDSGTKEIKKLYNIYELKSIGNKLHFTGQET